MHRRARMDLCRSRITDRAQCSPCLASQYTSTAAYIQPPPSTATNGTHVEPSKNDPNPPTHAVNHTRHLRGHTSAWGYRAVLCLSSLQRHPTRVAAARLSSGRVLTVAQ